MCWAHQIRCWPGSRQICLENDFEVDSGLQSSDAADGSAVHRTAFFGGIVLQGLRLSVAFGHDAILGDAPADQIISDFTGPVAAQLQVVIRTADIVSMPSDLYLNRFVALPPSRLEQIEKLEQLRALENNFDIVVADACDDCGFGIDTQSDFDRFRMHQH